MRCAIHSADAGSIMVIPRESKLIRLYIQLTELSAGGRQIDRSQITPEMILRSAQKIMKPFDLTYEYCDWWTIYQASIFVSRTCSPADVRTDWTAGRR